MKKFLLATLILIINYQLSIVNCHAQYINLHDFTGGVDGKRPFYSTFVSDGTYLYGMTLDGGIYGEGIIFKISPDGSTYSLIRSFAGAGVSTDGGKPYGSLYYDGTYLYGMTQTGGPTGSGGLFKIKPDG